MISEQKKGSLGVSSMVVIAVAVLIGVVTIMFTTDIFSEGGGQLADNIVKSCQKSLDGEGSYLVQQLRGDCPCDIDDEDNDNYLGKYYVVQESALEYAELIFTDAFLKENTPLKIYELDLDVIYDLIEDMEDGTLDRNHDFSYKLNVGLKSDFEKDSRQAFCPEYPNNCQYGIFMETWFENGLTEQGSCKTPEDVCKQRLVDACDDSAVSGKGTVS